MQRKLLFTHIDDQGHACLEDQDGNTVSLPLKWMPKNAHPGAVLMGVAVSNDDVSSMFFEIDPEASDWNSKSVVDEQKLETLLEP